VIGHPPIDMSKGKLAELPQCLGMPPQRLDASGVS